MTLAVRQSVPLYRPVRRQAGRCLGIFAALLVAAAAVACSSAIPTPEPSAAEPTVASSPTRAPAPGATQAVTPPAATPTAVPTSAAKPTPATTLPVTPPTATPAPTVGATVGPGSDRPLPDGLAPVSGEVFAVLTTLLEELGPRQSATGQELRAAEYLKERFEEMGYAAQIRPFTFQRASREKSGMTIDSPAPQEVYAFPLPGTGAGAASGLLLSVGLARPEATAGDGLAGKVALVEAGIIPLQEKLDNLAAAGAAAVILNNLDALNAGEWLTVEAEIPLLAVFHYEEGLLKALLEDGAVTVSVTVEADEFESRNVIAELEGTGDDVIIVGAHYDTAPGVAGANDNGSGTAIVLSLAETLAGRKLPFNVRFILFGAEEMGLFGSRHYVESLPGPEVDRIQAMLNFDSVATGLRLAVLGQQDLTGLALELAEGLAVAAEASRGLPRGSASDHTSFEYAGVPVLMFFGPDLSRIHTAADNTLEFVQPELLDGAAAVARALLQSPEFAEAVTAR